MHRLVSAFISTFLFVTPGGALPAHAQHDESLNLDIIAEIYLEAARKTWECTFSCAGNAAIRTEYIAATDAAQARTYTLALEMYNCGKEGAKIDAETVQCTEIQKHTATDISVESSSDDGSLPEVPIEDAPVETAVEQPLSGEDESALTQELDLLADVFLELLDRSWDCTFWCQGKLNERDKRVVFASAPDADQARAGVLNLQASLCNGAGENGKIDLINGITCVEKKKSADDADAVEIKSPEDR